MERNPVLMEPELHVVNSAREQSSFRHGLEGYQRGTRDNLSVRVRHGELADRLIDSQRCDQRLFGELRGRGQARRLPASDSDHDVIRETDLYEVVGAFIDTRTQHSLASLFDTCRFVEGVTVVQQG